MAGRKNLPRFLPDNMDLLRAGSPWPRSFGIPVLALRNSTEEHDSVFWMYTMHFNREPHCRLSVRTNTFCSRCRTRGRKHYVNLRV